MKVLQDLFNSVYNIDNLKNDINVAKNEKNERLKELLEVLPFSQTDNYLEIIEHIAKTIAFKTFSLGFSLGTKITAEAFINNENTSK